MHNKKLFIDINLTICLVLFIVISTVCIYSAELLLRGPNVLYLKQLMIYGIGIATILVILKSNISFLVEHAYWWYFLGVLSLILVLIFGVEINHAKCWFVIPHFGNIQPSEFMKIFLIFVIAKECANFMKSKKVHTLKQEFFFLCKILIIVLIPSFFTFLEPDTGAVFMYFMIAIIMLFISGIRMRWFTITFCIASLIIGVILILYTFQKELFIDLLGTNLFYRIDRLLNWKTGSGMQLENALMAVGSAGLFGHGLFHTPIYFPEPQTDFIFSVYTSNFGFLGAIVLIGLFLYFDLTVLNVAMKSNKKIHQLLIAGFLGILLYQQIQNIGMTLGLLPITGITLPFISYGGSSLLSYMVMLGVVFYISRYNLKYTN